MADLQRQVAHLERLLDITRQMAASTDVKQLLTTIINAAREVLDCERATIFLYDKHVHELCSSVATGIEEIRFPADRGIAGSAATDRAVINVADAYNDPRFNPDIDRKTGFRTRNLLTFPLENLQGELMGVLQALNKRSGPFQPDDEHLARVLSAQAGVALHRCALLEEYAEKQRMARDLELARSIQQQLFPADNPHVPGYDIAGWNHSADETGGDCYDFITLPDNRQAVFLADASGHGIGAALIIAQCRALVRAMLTVTQDLRLVAERVNQLLIRDLYEGRFVTAFVGVLDQHKHQLEYVAAGQGPLLLVSPNQVEQRNATTLPLAITNAFEPATDTFDIPPGGIVTLLTDGFFEAESPAGDQFGEQRAIQVLRDQLELPLAQLLDKLHESVRVFCADAPYADDLTALLVRRHT